MTKRIALNAGILCLAVAAAFLASAFVADDAFAKHKKPATTSSSDPCAEPTAFVQDHIAKIRALKATLNSNAHGSVASLFGGGAQRADDQDTMVKISDLRHDADGVNDLLRAGGCKTIDIDAGIKTAAAPAAAPVQVAKKKHH